jgi:hypothetical protein
MITTTPALPRCTCGSIKFAERVDRTRFVAERWRVVGNGGGFGAAAFGTSFGTSTEQAWGRFRIPVVTGVRNTVCLSCARIRRGVPVGGGIAMGSWLEGSTVCALMTDVVDPGCITARFSLDRGDFYEVSVEPRFIDPQEVPALPGSPLEQRELLPAGAVAPTRVYRVALPESVAQSGTYRLTFRDRCLDSSQSIIELELTAGILSLYGRQGEVVGEFGDYAASQVLADPEDMPGVDQGAFLEQVQATLEGAIELGLDLGGTTAVPQVVGIRGRAVEDATPPDGAQLKWSAANQRWEMG